MIKFELSSILFVNLYIDLCKSSAKEEIPLEANMLRTGTIWLIYKYKEDDEEH